MCTALTIACSGSEASPDAGRNEPVDASPMDAAEPSVDSGPPDAAVEPLDASYDVDATIDVLLELGCDAFAYARCVPWWSCGCGAEGELPPDDPEACLAEVRAACAESNRAHMTELVSTYRPTFDEDAIAPCRAARRHGWDLCLSPADVPGVPSACLDTMTLSVSLGAPCPHDGPGCAAGAGVCHRGTCVPLGTAPGEPCTAGCVRGLACVLGVCDTPRAAGEPCVVWSDCADDLACIEGRCGDPAREGEPCDESRPCGAVLGCEDGTCVAPTGCSGTVGECGLSGACTLPGASTCRAGLGVGETCGPTTGPCAPELRCEATSRCAPLPDLGESCSIDGCRPGLHCDGSTCVASRGAGAACADDVHACDPSLACVEGACGARPGDGEPCGADGRCAEGTGCVGSDVPTCRRFAPVGASCEAAPCDPGATCERSSVGAVCTPLPREGEPCGTICAPGLFCAPPPRRCRSSMCGSLEVLPWD